MFLVRADKKTRRAVFSELATRNMSYDTLLATLTFDEKKRVESFLARYQNRDQVTVVTELEWTRKATMVVDRTRLTGADKRELVVAMHQRLAAMRHNGFRGDVDVGGMVQFVFDTYHRKFGFRLGRGLCCLRPCHCLYHADDGRLELSAPQAQTMNTDQAVLEEQKIR